MAHSSPEYMQKYMREYRRRKKAELETLKKLGGNADLEREVLLKLVTRLGG